MYTIAALGTTTFVIAWPCVFDVKKVNDSSRVNNILIMQLVYGEKEASNVIKVKQERKHFV
jgi:hypothetical protein